MKIPMIIIAVIVGLVVAFAGYSWLNQPRPMSERLDSGASALSNGNVGEALDEVGNSTNGEKLQDDIKDATQPSAH